MIVVLFLFLLFIFFIVHFLYRSSSLYHHWIIPQQHGTHSTCGFLWQMGKGSSDKKVTSSMSGMSIVEGDEEEEEEESDDDGQGF